MKFMRITTMLALSLMTGFVYADDAINGSQTNQAPEDPCIRLEQLFQEGDRRKDQYICLDLYFFLYTNAVLQQKMAPFRDLIKNEQTPLATKIALAKICYKKPLISNKELLEQCDPETFALAVEYARRKRIVGGFRLLGHEEMEEERMMLRAIFDEARANKISCEQFKEQIKPFNKDLKKNLKDLVEVMEQGEGVFNIYYQRFIDIFLQPCTSRMEVLKERDPEMYKAVEAFVRHAKAQGIEIA